MSAGDPEAERLYHRHFTPAEANGMLPTLKPLLRRLRDAKGALTDDEAHRVLSDAASGNGGGEPGTRVGVAYLELRRLLEALEQAGVVIKDIDRGLVDFPAVVEGREVFLCWELGEDEVAYWHELEAGYRGRRPLD